MPNHIKIELYERAKEDFRLIGDALQNDLKVSIITLIIVIVIP